MLENKAQNSSGKPALRSTKFHALSRVTEEGYNNVLLDAAVATADSPLAEPALYAYRIESVETNPTLKG